MRNASGQAQEDISAILQSTGSEVIQWKDIPGPGGTDLEAHWPTGTKWLLQVRDTQDGLSTNNELGKLRLRAASMGATPVLALVQGQQVEFRSATDQALLELPEESQ